MLLPIFVDMMLMIRRLCLLVVALMMLGINYAEARRKKTKTSNTEIQAKETSYPEEVAQLIDYGKELLGRRYRSRGPGGVTLDCSGFVSYVFSKLNISLPRSSSAMSGFTQPISQSDIRPGDLLYYRGRGRRGVGHVAMVIDVDGDDIKMIHSSTSRGVVIEPYKGSAYFARRYVGAGRVTALEALLKHKEESQSERN